MSGMTGGEIQVAMESDSRTALPEYLTGKEPQKISGSIVVWDETEMAPVRTLKWEEAYVYAASEAVQKHSPLPIMLMVSIIPLRLDIGRNLRIDRRWPRTQGFWWEGYVHEEKIIVAAPKTDPKVLVKKVEGPNEGFPNENLTFKVTELPIHQLPPTVRM